MVTPWTGDYESERQGRSRSYTLLFGGRLADRILTPDL